MTVVLQDPVRSRDPSSRHAFPTVEGEADLRAPRTLAEELLAGFRAARPEDETSFALEPRGGYAAPDVVPTSPTNATKEKSSAS
jgi:hypothetical protein